MELSILGLKNILSEQGEKRVSRDSAEELGEVLEFWASGIASRAQRIAEQKGRKTVRAEDIRAALQELKHGHRPDYRQISTPENTRKESLVIRRLQK